MNRPAPRPAAWEAEPDGRRQRTLRTRAAIVDALIALVGAGNHRPTAREIAAHAGVAIRSIGQHFATREELFAAAAMQVGAQIERGEPVDAALPLAERVPAFVRARAVFLEASRAFRIAALAAAPRSPVVTQVLDAYTKARRADLGRVFAAELSARDPGARAILFDALDLAISGRAWDALRDELGLEAIAAEARLHLLVARLLA